jgi:hypothetical protein
LFQGMVDSGMVTLSIRKVSKKGPVMGYKLVGRKRKRRLSSVCWHSTLYWSKVLPIR